MSALTDLQDSVDKNFTEVARVAALVQSLKDQIAALPAGADDASLNALKAKLDSANASLQALS